MTLRINQNVSAMNTHRVLTGTAKGLAGSLEKLSSGLRINRASDDAAGLSISEKMRSQVRGLAQAERNSQDAISMINTAEGAADEIHSILQRMRELAVQGSNGTLVAADRQAIGQEYDALRSEIDDIASKTKFNQQTLIDESLNTAAASSLTAAEFVATQEEVVGGVTYATGATVPAQYVTITATNPTQFTYQVGFNTSDTISVEFSSLKATSQNASSTEGLGLGTQAYGVSSTTAENFRSAIGSLDIAIASVSNLRTKLGASVNRLESRIKSLSVGRENIAAAENRIRDVDMAAEMTEVSRRQILFQSGTSMLSQANSNPQNVMSLFR